MLFKIAITVEPPEMNLFEDDDLLGEDLDKEKDGDGQFGPKYTVHSQGGAGGSVCGPSSLSGSINSTNTSSGNPSGTKQTALSYLNQLQDPLPDDLYLSSSLGLEPPSLLNQPLDGSQSSGGNNNASTSQSALEFLQ